MENHSTIHGTIDLLLVNSTSSKNRLVPTYRIQYINVHNSWKIQNTHTVSQSSELVDIYSIQGTKVSSSILTKHNHSPLLLMQISVATGTSTSLRKILTQQNPEPDLSSNTPIHHSFGNQNYEQVSL
jgi:hypothetical protein